MASSAGPLRIAVPLAAAILLVLAAFAGLLGVAIGSNPCADDDHAGPNADPNRHIPPGYLIPYRTAGSEFGVPWEVLAAIGGIETDHGRSTARSVRSGLNRHGCCAGPMQLNLIEADLNDLELTATIGHSGSGTTKRIHGHLFPDSRATIAAKLDAYHARPGSSDVR